MDCEVGRIAPCANCGRFSCGSTQEHSYGPGGPCSAVTMCDTCGISYCEECRDEYGAFGVLYCDACGTSYCEDCRPMAFCDICQNGFCCDDCRVVESCADCDTWFCADCDPVLKCNNCDKTICTKCSHGNEEIGIPHMCRDCERDAKALLRKELAKESGEYATLTARVAADEAGPWEARPWSFGERQALSLVVAGLPQPYLNEVFSIIGLGQTFPDGSFRVVDLPRGASPLAPRIRLRPRASSASSPWRKPPTTRTRLTTRLRTASAAIEAKPEEVRAREVRGTPPLKKTTHRFFVRLCSRPCAESALGARLPLLLAGSAVDAGRTVKAKPIKLGHAHARAVLRLLALALEDLARVILIVVDARRLAVDGRPPRRHRFQGLHVADLPDHWSSPGLHEIPRHRPIISRFLLVVRHLHHDAAYSRSLQMLGLRRQFTHGFQQCRPDSEHRLDALVRREPLPHQIQGVVLQ